MNAVNNWRKISEQVEALEGLTLSAGLVDDMHARFAKLHGKHVGRINFYTPTFKAFSSSEISGCGKSAWPAISITGGDCKLQCDHCKAKILEPMIAARTPQELWKIVVSQIEGGAQGMLLTGGSNRRNEVEYDAYYPVIRQIKDKFPQFKIAMHTALVDMDIARRMEDCGIDAAMMDVIGAQDTITQVYHLKRNVEDFERTLEYLVSTRLRVVPHIVIGLHYGSLLGEWNALEMIKRHLPTAVVLVVVMPMYAPLQRPFATPDPAQVGRFFMDAREALPNIPLLLGCARPAGQVKVEIDSYAVMAGLNGVAHPSDGMVELAVRMDREVRVTPACCSIAIGDEVMAIDTGEAGLEVDISQLIASERARKNKVGSLGGIKIVPA